MDVLQQGIVTLIRSSLTGERLSLPEGFDLETAYPQILRHGILTMAYDGALRCGVDKKLPVMQKMFQGYLKCLLQSEGQMKAVDQICVAFDAASVDYLPLKGCNLKLLYPKQELRLMGDADILIRREQYDKICLLMQRLAFEKRSECDHVYEWNSNCLHVELHKRVVPTYDIDFYDYFGDGWLKAKLDVGSKYKFRPEDEFIFIFAHFAKHYRDGGIGLRHVVDLLVFQHAYPKLDYSYIEEELSRLSLHLFYQNIVRLLQVWFEDAETDEKTEFITRFIFESGVFGKSEDRILASGVKNASLVGSAEMGRAMYAREMLFPSLFEMKQKYAILLKAPVVLPVLWVVRWGGALLFRRQNIRIQKAKLRITTPDNIETYQQALNYVGLDFHFKED